MRTPLRRKPIEIELPEFGISAFASRHAPSFTMPLATQAYHKLCLIEAGQGSLQLDSMAAALGPASLIRVPPNVPHRFVDNAASPMTLSALCFHAEAFAAPCTVRQVWERLRQQLPAGSPRPIIYENDRANFQRLFRNIVLEMGQELPGRPASVFALSTELFVRATRCLARQVDLDSGDASPQFAASLAEIDNRFTEDLRIEDLAKQAGMSYRAYTEHFRKHTGTTVMQYVLHRRLGFAKRRMLEPEDILGSSLEAGFRDLSHFYRVFKRELGETPQAFINRHLGVATT